MFFCFTQDQQLAELLPEFNYRTWLRHEEDTCTSKLLGALIYLKRIIKARAEYNLKYLKQKIVIERKQYENLQLSWN